MSNNNKDITNVIDAEIAQEPEQQELVLADNTLESPE